MHMVTLLLSWPLMCRPSQLQGLPSDSLVADALQELMQSRHQPQPAEGTAVQTLQPAVSSLQQEPAQAPTAQLSAASPYPDAAAAGKTKAVQQAESSVQTIAGKLADSAAQTQSDQLMPVQGQPQAAQPALQAQAHTAQPDAASAAPRAEHMAAAQLADSSAQKAGGKQADSAAQTQSNQLFRDQAQHQEVRQAEPAIQATASLLPSAQQSWENLPADALIADALDELQASSTWQRAQPDRAAQTAGVRPWSELDDHDFQPFPPLHLHATASNYTFQNLMLYRAYDDHCCSTMQTAFWPCFLKLGPLQARTWQRRRPLCSKPRPKARPAQQLQQRSRSPQPLQAQ